MTTADLAPVYYCSGPSCPGLPYRASDLAHPASHAATHERDVEHGPDCSGGQNCADVTAKTRCGVLAHGPNCHNGPCYVENTHEVEVSIALCDGMNPGFGYALKVTRRDVTLLATTRDPVTGEHLTYEAALRVALTYATKPNGGRS
jgi:hypothetical protein